LWAAIAARDSPGIARLGSELLAPRAGASDADIAYLTTVTAAADVRMGKRAEARQLLQLQWRRFDHSGEFDFALRELQALTR
jgi:hypothetical protein